MHTLTGGVTLYQAYELHQLQLVSDLMNIIPNTPTIPHINL